MSESINLIFIFGAKYLYLVAILISLAWFLSQPRAVQKEVLIMACVCLPLMFIIFEIASSFYYNPRPFVAGHFNPLIQHKADNGFPSHHMLLAGAIAAIIFPFNRRLSIGLWILAIFVGFSRVYAGVHHIVDIIGSLIISICGVVLGYFLIKYLKGRKARIFRRSKA